MVKPRAATASSGDNSFAGTGGTGVAPGGSGGEFRGTPGATGGSILTSGGAPGAGGGLVLTGSGSSVTGGAHAFGGGVGGTGGGGSLHAEGAMSTGGATAQGGSSGTGGYCGNGTISPGEQCDLGTGNQNWPAFWVNQAGRGFAAAPLVQTISSPSFYSYSSVSAHTGFEAVGASRILLHLDETTLVLSLIVIHGVDYDATNQDQPESLVSMTFRGLPDTTTVEVSDDRNELVMTSPTTATALWPFTSNSDGGVLSGLPVPGDWEITVEPAFLKGISTWDWVQGDGSLVSLDLTQPLTIKAYDSPASVASTAPAPSAATGSWMVAEAVRREKPDKQ